MTYTDMTSHRPGRRARWIALATAGALVGIAACKDSNVPFFTAPTGVSNTPAGLQNAISGVFGASRIDIGGFVTTVAAGYARDGAVFVNTEARTVEYPLGVFPTPTSSGSYWAQEYQNIHQSQQVLAAIPNISPAYSATDQAAITGVVQTIEAYNYMIVAEAHDTLGIAILPVGLSASAQAPAVCMKNGWQYIVALLDSAEANLETAGPVAIPIKLPTGFGGVGVTAAPSTAAGSFASFNRALAAKANLELAYAIARSAPVGSPLAPGAPDAAALTAAATALNASAMFTTATLAPPTVPFAPSANNVVWDFSAQSGDIGNPIFGEIGTVAQLNDFVADVDTVNDLRWKVKFGKNPHPVQQNFYNPVASKYIPAAYPSPGASIPIVRPTQLFLWDAQILLGQGNAAGAFAIVQQIRAQTGGPALTPYPAGDASSAVAVRNDLMKEQRISTSWEASADRTISIRMYALAAVADTTWSHEDPNVTSPDVHTTVNPVPNTEILGRGGSFTTTCQ